MLPLIAWVLCCAAVLTAAALADIPPTKSALLNVRNMGAVGDGKADDHLAIQKAIDQCSASGGGTVVVPAGTYYGCGIHLQSHVTLRLDANALLQGPSKTADYPKRAGDKTSGWAGSSYGMVAAENCTDVAITGSGRIDAAGQEAGEIERAKKAEMKATGQTIKAGGSATERPRMVQFANCQNVRVSGITLSNSQMWNLVFTHCRDIAVDGLTITAAPDAPETDGIDIRGCHHAHISHCHIDNGDDNVAITGIRQQPDLGEVSCEDVEVNDCQFLHGHGVSIGSPTMNGVRNVRVHDCTFDGTTNGIRIKSMRDRGGTVEDVHYDRLTMKNVNPAITINAYYTHPPAADTAQPITKTTPVFRNIFINDLTATCPKSAGMIVGLPESPVDGLMLKNVKISAPTGLVMRNADDVGMHAVDLQIGSGPAILIDHATTKPE